MNEKQVYENQETAIKLLEENVKYKKALLDIKEYIETQRSEYLSFKYDEVLDIVNKAIGSDKNE